MGKRANGEGTIYHTPEGSWLAQITIDGKRLGHRFKTQKECLEWLKKTNEQTNQGMTINGTKTRLDTFLDVWIESKASKLRMSTRQQYGFMIRLYLKPNLGKVPLMELDAARIQTFYNSLVKQGAGLRTVEVTHTVLHGCLAYAHRLGLITQNWCDLVEVPRPARREMQVWSESQVNQFLIGCNDQTFYRMAFATGMRRGELLGLKGEDIDWNSGSLKIRRQAYEMPGGGYRFQEPKTARGRRLVRLGAGLLEALQFQYNQVLPQARAIAGDRWIENDLIFPTSIGTPRNGSNVSNEFQDQVKLSGLPKIRFHDIRHTAASIMLLHGEPPVRVAAILGQSMAVLMDTYAHYIPDDQATASALMDQVTTPVRIDLSGCNTIATKTESGKKHDPHI